MSASEEQIKAAQDAGERRFLEVGRMPTGDEFKRLGYTLDEVKAFVLGFETRRVEVLRSGGSIGHA